MFGTAAPATSTTTPLSDVRFSALIPENLPLSILFNIPLANDGKLASKINAALPNTSHTNPSKTTNTIISFNSLLKPARNPTNADNANIPNAASANINIIVFTLGIAANINIIVFTFGITFTSFLKIYSLILPKICFLVKQCIYFSNFFLKF